MLDRHARRRIRNAIVGAIGSRVLRLWVLTLRVRMLGFFRDGRVVLPPRSAICVLWHEHLLLPAGHFRGSRFRALISRHADGEMIARVIEGLGMRPLRGSTRRGGARAILEVLREHGAAERLHVIVTPDGPQGPHRRFQAGAVYLAARTGLPVCLVGIAVKPCVRLPTWDGFRLPFPFGRGIVRLSEPIFVPPDLDRKEIERHRRELEHRLNEFNDETERDFERLWSEALPRRKLLSLDAAAAAGAVEPSDAGRSSG